MKNPIYISILIFLFVSACFAQEAPWLKQIKQIGPLKSTEKDVEKIFGNPSDWYTNRASYKLSEGQITFTYSEGKCGENKDSGYDVEKGTVVEIYFYTPKNIKFKSLNVNLDGFNKKYATDLTNTFSYEDKKLGIRYSISYGWLVSITMNPAERHAYLACPKNNSAYTDSR
jgi:hypothetical protein